MHADFLAAIRAEPDDLTHRLVYADWLEEHGSSDVERAQAELIRVQIAREAADADGDDYWSLRARERWLLARWGTGLGGALPAFARGHEFRRGFIEHVAVDAGVFEAMAERMLALAPIRSVALRGPLRRFMPEVTRRFREVDLGRAFDNGVGTPVAWLDAERLTALTVNSQWADGLAGLLASGLPALERLVLTDEGQSINLAASLPRLRALSMCPAWESEGAFAAFLAAPGLARLESAHFRRMSLPRDELFHRLAESPTAAGLQQLRLDGFPVPMLAAAGPYLAGLRSLEIAGATTLWEPAADWLCRLPMPELRRLRISGTHLPDASAERIFRCPGWPRLHTLELVAPEALHPRTLAALIEGPLLPNLRRLELATIDTDSFRRLVLGLRAVGGDEIDAGQGPGRLAELVIDAAAPGTRLEPVFRSPYLGRLTTLEVRHLGSGGLSPLPDAALPALTWLDVRGTDLPAGWKADLRRRLGPGLRASRLQRPRPVVPRWTGDGDIPF